MLKSNGKATICVKRTQSGKTSEMINKIKYNDTLDKNKKSLHIIVNNPITNIMVQTRTRILNSKIFNEENIVDLSTTSKSKTTVKKIDELIGMLLNVDYDIKLISLMAVDIRKNDLIKIVKNCNNYEKYDKIYVYFDELHNYISNWRTVIDEIKTFEKVYDIIGYTATPYAIWESEDQNWETLNIVEYIDDFKSDVYVGCKDMIWKTNIIDPEQYYLDNIEKIIKSDKLLDNNNNKIMIIGEIKNVSHDDIMDMILRNNNKTAICIINNTKKSIFIDGNEYKINSYENSEFGSKIYNILEKNKGLNRPLVITGNKCIGIGQTYADKDLGNITHGIFIKNNITKDKDYQQFGRLTGPYKTFKKYIKPTVYCNELFKQNCIDLEFCALNVSNNFLGSELTLENYKANRLKTNLNRPKKEKIIGYDGEIPLKITIQKVFLEKMKKIKDENKYRPKLRKDNYYSILSEAVFDYKEIILNEFNKYNMTFDEFVNDNEILYLRAKKCIETKKCFGKQGLDKRKDQDKQMRLFVNIEKEELIVCYYDWEKDNTISKDTIVSTKTNDDNDSLIESYSTTTTNYDSMSTNTTNILNKKKLENFETFASKYLKDKQIIKHKIDKDNFILGKYDKSKNEITIDGKNFSLNQFCLYNYKKFNKNFASRNGFLVCYVKYEKEWISLHKYREIKNKIN